MAKGKRKASRNRAGVRPKPPSKGASAPKASSGRARRPETTPAGPRRPASTPARARRVPVAPSREEIRVRRIRAAVVAGSTAFALFVLVVLLIYAHRLNPEERRLLAGAAGAARSAGCTDVQTTAPYHGGLDRAHVGVGGPVPTFPPLETYPSKPPASGPHASGTLGAGVYPDPPSIAEAIHSLEHGAAIVWLAPDALSDPQVESIESFFRRGNERNHVIVAPFDYPDQGEEGSLPAGTQMALVAWHRLQVCDRPSLAAAFSFVERYRFNLWRRGSYRGEAPEKYSPI